MILELRYETRPMIYPVKLERRRHLEFLLQRDVCNDMDFDVMLSVNRSSGSKGQWDIWVTTRELPPSPAPRTDGFLGDNPLNKHLKRSSLGGGSGVVWGVT